MIATGGCQCGAIRYTVGGSGLIAYACHCRECRKQSASAFGLSVPVQKDRIRFQGALSCYTRQTDSGARTSCWFCPACGSRIHHQSDRASAYLTLKGGSLDDIHDVRLAAHIWVRRKLPWVVLDPDVPAHDTQPCDLDAWRASLLAGI